MHMATKTKRWTLEEVHSLPDDGNKYELVRGELFVTPPPSFEHETVIARLSRHLDRYVEANGLGLVYHARSVMRFEGSEVEPDIMVRDRGTSATNWGNAPVPRLIVEVLSGSTRRRDQLQKRSLYLDAGVEEYWMVDDERRRVTVARPGEPDRSFADVLVWQPRGAEEPLSTRLTEFLD